LGPHTRKKIQKKKSINNNISKKYSSEKRMSEHLENDQKIVEEVQKKNIKIGI
jgi:hypothetical protein